MSMCVLAISQSIDRGEVYRYSFSTTGLSQQEVPPSQDVSYWHQKHLTNNPPPQKKRTQIVNGKSPHANLNLLQLVIYTKTNKDLLHPPGRPIVSGNGFLSENPFPDGLSCCISTLILKTWSERCPQTDFRLFERVERLSCGFAMHHSCL